MDEQGRHLCRDTNALSSQHRSGLLDTAGKTVPLTHRLAHRSKIFFGQLIVWIRFHHAPPVLYGARAVARLEFANGGWQKIVYFRLSQFYESVIGYTGCIPSLGLNVQPSSIFKQFC